MLPLIAARLFAPPASTMIAIMMAVTSSLIVGYSWQDQHLAQYGNPGVGYSVAWRVRPPRSAPSVQVADRHVLQRALLVIIGAVSLPSGLASKTRNLN